MQYKYSELGQKLANPHAIPSNALKLAKCDCSPAATCQHTLTAPIAPVKGFVFDGITYLVSDYYMNTSELSDTDRIRTFLNTVLSSREFNLYFDVTDDGTDLTFFHIGQCPLEQVIFGDDTTADFESCCNIVNAFKYQTILEGETMPIIFGDLSEDLANSPYAYVVGDAAANQTTADTLQADVEAALDALGVPYTEVSVTVNDTTGVFVLDVSVTERLQLKHGMVDFQYCLVEEAFHCPDGGKSREVSGGGKRETPAPKVATKDATKPTAKTKPTASKTAAKK